MDGSYKDEHGTAAFRIQNDLGDQITGCNITPGLQEHQSAYRSKLGGIVGIPVLLDLLQQHYSLRIQQFIITCDCNGAGLKSLTYHQLPTANNDNYDLLTQAYKIKTKATIDTVYQWVEGHQADRYGTKKLDKYGLLNDAMDKLAKQYWEATKNMNLPPQQIISDQEWSIWIANRKITGDTLNTVRRHIQETEMSKWLAAPRKHGREPRLSLTLQQLINTKAITDSWKDILHGQRKWLTKMCQRFAPVGKNMHRWGFWTNSRCPACHRDNEDEDHLFKCPDQKSKYICTEATRVLQQCLQRCKTEPLLRDTILQKVQQYTGLAPRTELEIDDNDIRTAIHSQGTIGWHNFLLGQTARQFEAIQQEYITATRQWNSAPFWAKNLTLALWEFSLTIWKYRNETLHECTGVDRQDTH
jgi:hypothetical protein